MRENRAAARVLWTLVKSALATAAIFADVSGSGIRGILGMDNLSGLILGLGIFALFFYMDKHTQDKRRTLSGMLCAALFSAFMLIGKSFSVNGFNNHDTVERLLDEQTGLFATGRVFAEGGGFAPLFSSPVRLLCTLVIFLGFFLLLERAYAFAYAKLASRGTDTGILKRLFPDRASVLRMSVILFVCWLPYLITTFPGGQSGDMRDQVAQFFGHDCRTARLAEVIYEDVYLTNMNPVGHTLWLGSVIALFKRGSDITLGIFAFNLIQTCAFAYVFARSIDAMRRIGLSRTFRLGALAFYAINPLLPLYAYSVAKDSAFAILLLMLIVMLIEAYAEPERLTSPLHLAGMGFVILLFILFRNSANLIAAAAVPAAYFALSKKLSGKGIRPRIALLSAMILPILLGLVITNVVYPAVGVRKAPWRESNSLLFQQSARYALTYPDEVTEEERAAISAVLPFDDFEVRYMPGQADPIKDTISGVTQEEIDAYKKAWRAQFAKHPLSYLEAAIDMGYAYYYPAMQMSDYWLRYFIGFSYRYEFDGEVFEVIQPRLISKLARLTGSAVNHVSSLPIVGALFNIGLYAWILIAAAFLCARARGRLGALYLPYLAFMIGVGLTAVNGSIRYALAVIVAAPMIIAIAKHAVQTRTQIVQDGRQA